MQPIDRRIIHTVIVSAAFQRVYYTRNKMFTPESVVPNMEIELPRRGSDIIAMSGIANNTQFVREMQSRYNVVDTLNFNDHHRYVKGDLKRMEGMLNKHKDALIITTEKDAVKLMRSRAISEELASRLLYIPISIDFIDGNLSDFLMNIQKDVKRLV